MEASGFEVIERVIGEAERDALLDCFPRGGGRVGHRHGLDHEAIRVLAANLLSDERIARRLSGDVLAVRALLFDKSPEANWPVAFHQDTTVAVSERRGAPGYAAWSCKDGVDHVRPPASVLSSMLSVRVDLDGSDATNGALRVVPGSHQRGVLEREEIEEWVASSIPVTCTVPKCGALLMRPLLVHGSRRSTASQHRRVVHIEFGPRELPGALEWHAPTR